MGLLNFSSSTSSSSSSKKNMPKQWRILDFATFSLFGTVFIFFLMVFTPLGDSLAASGRQTLVTSTSDPRQRQKLLALLESGKQQQSLEACPAEAVDHMPCEDPRRNSQLSREMNFYRERHCPLPEETPLCLIPPPEGYQIPVKWPESLHKIWHNNVPHSKIADRKGHQGWMKQEGSYFTFPGGGTMFPDGAVSYIQRLGQYIPLSGGVLRTALDMGCGVASFGAYLLKEDILTLSFAPRDSHKAQIQFALERGIPAFIAMLGTRRLPLPAYSFDLMHCSRCLIPFTAYNGTYFAEVDRLLRPGGYLVISGPPVQWSKQDKEWADLQAVATALCYELIVVDGNTVIWKKPTTDSCFPVQNEFGLAVCSKPEDPSYAWYYKLNRCISKIPSLMGGLSVGTISNWPERLTKPPLRAGLLKNGINVFEADSRRWQRRVAYYKSLNLKLGTPAVRNVMDMNAFFGGFAAALSSDPIWVMNVVPVQSPSTLGVIYDRGLIGIYHDWCEPFSTYPRTYDFIHVAGLDTLTKKHGANSRCSLVDLMVEIDRMLRPEGTIVVRDSPEVTERVSLIARAIRWNVVIHNSEPESQQREQILVATKQFWRL